MSGEITAIDGLMGEGGSLKFIDKYITLVYPDGKEVCAEGYIYGNITDNPRGSGGLFFCT